MKIIEYIVIDTDIAAGDPYAILGFGLTRTEAIKYALRWLDDTERDWEYKRELTCLLYDEPGTGNVIAIDSSAPEFAVYLSADPSFVKADYGWTTRCR